MLAGAEEEGGGRGAESGGRGEARARLGAPARPPREPTAARGLLELRGPRARALYTAREPRGGGAEHPGGGDCPPTRRGLQATPPAGSPTSGAFSPSHWSPPIFPPSGKRAGRAAGASGRLAVLPLWVLLAGGGGKVPLSSASGVPTLESTFTFCDRARAALDVPSPSRSSCAERRSFLSAVLVFARRAGIAKCNNIAIVSVARLLGKGCLGLGRPRARGLSRRWALLHVETLSGWGRERPAWRSGGPFLRPSPRPGSVNRPSALGPAGQG